MIDPPRWTAAKNSFFGRSPMYYIYKRVAAQAVSRLDMPVAQMTDAAFAVQGIW